MNKSKLLRLSFLAAGALLFGHINAQAAPSHAVAASAAHSSLHGGFRGAGSGYYHGGGRYGHGHYWRGGWYPGLYFGYGYPYYGYGYGYPYGYYPYSYYPYGGVYEGRPVGYANGRVGVDVQRELAREGFYHGALDGVIGDGTRRAIRAYERAHNLRVTGQISGRLLSTMDLG
jgi:hypothetical protein